MTDGEWDNPYTGILARLSRIPAEGHDPEVALWGGVVPPWGPRGSDLMVGGASWSEELARRACVGEAIERLGAQGLPQDAGLRASWSGWPLDEPPVEPERWTLFHPDQHGQPDFPFPPFTRKTQCRWVCFREAASGAPHWVPEDIAFLWQAPDPGSRLCPSTSTGLSCGGEDVPVLLRGLQEVIERDGVLGAWWGSYGLEEWGQEDALAELEPERRGRLSRPHRRYRFYRVRSPYSDHVTIVTAEGEDREGFLFAAGSACRESRAESWSKSILEAVQGLVYVRQLRREGGGLRWADDLVDFRHHAAYYSAHPQELRRTVLSRAEAPAQGPSGSESLGMLRERLGPRFPVLFRLMTPPAVAEAFEGWRVLRVLVPGLQPLHGNHRWPHLGGPLWGRPVRDWDRMPPHPMA